MIGPSPTLTSAAKAYTLMGTPLSLVPISGKTKVNLRTDLYA